MKIHRKSQTSYKFKILHDFTYGWDDFGTEDDGVTPHYYDTFQEAYEEIKDIVEDKDLDESYTYDQFQIVRTSI